MPVAISVEDLSKKYLISHQKKEQYTALRDVVAGSAKALGRKLLRPFSGNDPATENDRSREEFWALKDLNFEIQEGDRVGIIGRNGAGKSTLLKILSRITEPSGGRAMIRGRVASLLEVGTGFHPELTGRENVYLNGAILGMRKAEIAAKFDEIVSFAEVERYIDTAVKRYSSGMYLRLAFAVAAHLEPDILIVDEVLAVGDVQFQKKCLGKMEEVSAKGRTVLFVSHNIGAIRTLCEKCILLKEGRLLGFRGVEEIVSSYLGVGHSNSTVEILPNMRNRGTGSVTFESCTICDNEGTPVKSFLIGQDFCIEIGLTIRTSNKLYFWLIIFDAEGRPVLSSHQGDVEMLRVQTGTYRLRCVTRQIALMPGSYTISAGAFDADRTFLEWIDNCQSFEVFPTFVGGKPFDHRWGAVNLNMHWELSPDDRQKT